MKLILITLTGLASSTFGAVELYSESFDTEANAKVKIVAGANTATVTSIDYSNFSIGTTVHHIPEAPSRISGSAPTRGFLMRQTYGGAARIINVLLADSLNGSPVFFTGSYRLKLDLFLNCTTANVAGTTEVAVFGIKNNDIGRIAYTARTTSAIGAWGWLSTEGGIGTTGDVGLYKNATRLASRENLTVPDVPLFKSAFPADSLPFANTPAQHWTRVELVCIADPPPGTSANVSLYFNGVKFCEGSADVTENFAVFGYEDAFPASNSAAPESQFALVDNVTVEELEPYELWIAQFFGVGENQAQPTADPDGDGFNNVLEYSFNLNPNFNQQPFPVDPSNPAGNTDGLGPVIEEVTSPRGLRLSFVRRTGESEVDFLFDVATSTGGWTSLPLTGATITPLAVGAGWEFVQFTAPATLLGPAANTTFFGRLRVVPY